MGYTNWDKCVKPPLIDFTGILSHNYHEFTAGVLVPFRDSITTCTCSIRGKSRLSPTLSYCIFYNTHPSAWTMYVYTCIYATHYSQETSIGFHFLVIVCAFHNEQFVNFYLYRMSQTATSLLEN